MIQEQKIGKIGLLAVPGYEVTISILRTEVANGNTYYVFSGMPSEDPYAPPRYFFADKKIRWSGNDLMVLNEARDIGVCSPEIRFAPQSQVQST